MRRSSLAVRVVLLIVSIVASTVLVQAQYRASIQGVVTDSQGAVVSGATVTLKNLETGQTSTDVTTERGVYNFSGLPPSKFALVVEKTGFKKKEIQSFGLVAEQANAVNVQLEIGQVTETVTVNGSEAPLIDTESANLGGSVQAQDYQKLPSIGRDAFQLLQLAPGAFGDGAQGAGGGTQDLPATTAHGSGGTEGIFRIENGGQITAGGARVGDNNYQIDGVGTTSVTWGGTSVVTPNEDSIKEIRIVTDNYDAENGRYRGAQVQIISQNGTNNYHGSLFFKAHRPGLDAFQKYNGYGNSIQRDANRFNDWGGTVGGPILKNRLFGFFSYETLSNNAQGQVGSGWYETPAYHALAASGTNASKFLSYPGSGQFGGTQSDTIPGGGAADCASVGLVEYGSIAAAPLVGNCVMIPGQGLSIGTPLTGVALGALDPAYGQCIYSISGNCQHFTPGSGGDGSLYNSGDVFDGGYHNLNPTTADIAFYRNIHNPANATHRQFNARADFNATSKDLIAFSMYYVPNSSTSINGNGTRQMNTFNSTYKNRAATLIWDHTFNPSLANEARINAAGWMEKDLAQNPGGPWGLPQVSFNAPGGVNAPNGYGIGSFNGFDQWTYAGKDVLTKIHGAHTMKMGGEFTRLLSVDAPFWSDRPGYSFNSAWDFLNDAAVSENGQFDPTTGVPSALRKDLRNNLMGIFFQDDWKVRPNLTVTAGMRWEYFGPISEKNGKLATVVLGSGANEFTNVRVRTGGSQFNAQKANFGPQLGFAWSPKGPAGNDYSNRLVVRGGMGIAYTGVTQSNTLDVRFNPPYVLNGASFSGSQVVYMNTFPSNVHSPYGYGPNNNAIVHFDANNLPLTGRTDLTAFAANEPTTYTMHYTLGGEYDLGHQWVLSLGYQGNTTRHLTQHYNLYNPGTVHNYALNPKVSGVTYYGNDGSARFNALLAEVKHNFSKSFMFDTQYRWSHSMDSGSNAYAGGNYQWNMKYAFATSDYDVRQAFKVYGVWSPTIFHGANDWKEKVAGGWSVSGIMNVHTGFPFNPFFPLNAIPGNSGYDPVFYFAQNGGGSSSDAGSTNYLAQKYNGGFTPRFKSNVSNVAGTTYFTAPTVVPGTLFDCLFPSPDPVTCPSGQQGYGPVPIAPGVARNAFTGPGYFGFDATLSKSFGLPKLPVMGENGKLEVRANFYNLFNKMNLNNIQADVTSGHFGEAQNGLGGRVVEMQARFNF